MERIYSLLRQRQRIVIGEMWTARLGQSPSRAVFLIVSPKGTAFACWRFGVIFVILVR